VSFANADLGSPSCASSHPLRRSPALYCARLCSTGSWMRKAARTTAMRSKLRISNCAAPPTVRHSVWMQMNNKRSRVSRSSLRSTLAPTSAPPTPSNRRDAWRRSRTSRRAITRRSSSSGTFWRLTTRVFSFGTRDFLSHPPSSIALGGGGRTTIMTGPTQN
jgi:hypothetical protein